MIKKILFISALVLTAGLSAQKSKILTPDEKLELIKSHDTAFQALNARVRDPFVHLGPDGYYYLTGTTAGSHWGDTIGIYLWKSKDLANWEEMGFVWNLHIDGKKNKSWHFEQPIKRPEFKNPLAVWAPEIHYMNGTWWIPHCLNVGGHGLLKSTTGKPEGPYEVVDPVQLKRIDAHLFKDTDETVYYCYQADMIAKMAPDMLSIVEEPRKLQHDGNHPMGYEGVFILKFDDKYLFIASGRYGYEPTNTYDLYYGVSKDVYGPYGKRRMAIKNAGHGNLFQDKDGKWWSTAFDHVYFDKGMDKWSLWLVPIDIEVTDDDILFHVKDSRFAPTQEDHDVVKQLSIDGVPAEWEGKSPWWYPGKDEKDKKKKKK